MTWHHSVTQHISILKEAFLHCLIHLIKQTVSVYQCIFGEPSLILYQHQKESISLLVFIPNQVSFILAPSTWSEDDVKALHQWEAARGLRLSWPELCSDLFQCRHWVTTTEEIFDRNLKVIETFVTSHLADYISDIMGAYLSEPVLDKHSSDEISACLSYGASSMQGWRVSQEVRN